MLSIFSDMQDSIDCISQHLQPRATASEREFKEREFKDGHHPLQILV